MQPFGFVSLAHRVISGLGPLLCVLVVAGCSAPEPNAAAETVQRDPQGQHCNTEGCECASQACAEGLLCDEQSHQCRQPIVCADLSCPSLYRACAPGDAGRDAACGACVAGYAEREEQDEACHPIVVGCEDACATGHRDCVTIESAPHCAGCTNGYFDRFGECTPLPRCLDDDPCAASNRTCTDTDGDRQFAPVCDACLAGFVPTRDGVCACPPGQYQDGVGCSPLPINVVGSDPYCNDCDCCEAAGLGCDAAAGCTTECLLPFHHYDSALHECVAEQHEDCDPDEGKWNGIECVTCPDCAGDEGLLTLHGWCICPTEDGEYWSTAGDVGAYPCDADGDGWVRDSARYAIESDDPVLRGQAQCALQVIEQITLQNEDGEVHVHPLGQPLALYETVRNDDQTLFDSAWAATELNETGWNSGVDVSVLNRFTKYCDQAQADYNDNGLPDATEFFNRTDPTQAAAERAVFHEFAYFAELHTGAVENGIWVISERSRGALPFTHPTEVGNEGLGTWSTCPRGRDPGAERTRLGNDFAAIGGGGLMTHHSQFKCVTAETVEAKHLLQSCTKGGDGSLESCSDTDHVDGAQWSLVDYQPHTTFIGYPGGCMNLCVAAGQGLVDPGCDATMTCAPVESQFELACKSCGDLQLDRF
jgi:hypothetical protein